MSKEKAVRDTNTATLPEKQPAKPVELTLANAPIYLAKFTELMVMELRRLNDNLEKMNE